METTPDYTIKFQPFEQAVNTGICDVRLAFKIEPPITVHSPGFLENVIKAKERERGIGPGSPPPPAYQALLTHTTKEGTYGTLHSEGALVSGPITESYRAKFKDYVQEIFSSALNPLGNLALAFIFEESEE